MIKNNHKWIESTRIQHLSLHRYEPRIYKHLTFIPYVSLQLLNCLLFCVIFKNMMYSFNIFIVLAIIFTLIYIFTYFLSYWNFSFRLRNLFNPVTRLPKISKFQKFKKELSFKRSSNRRSNNYNNKKNMSREKNVYVHVKPFKHRGLQSLEPLHIHESKLYYFEYQKRKYFLDPTEKKVFQKPPSTSNLSLAFYKGFKGHNENLEIEDSDEEDDFDDDESDDESGGMKIRKIEDYKKFYGKNEFDIPLPTFLEIYKEHAMKPFFVFQVFCVLLWCLDEMWYYSMFTLVMLFVFEATVVTQRINNLKFIRKMRIKNYKIRVKRNGKWRTIYTNELVPFDIISVPLGNQFVPCDILLLKGKVVVDESLLTGESTPQVKEHVRVEPNKEEFLNLKNNNYKRNILFGGTKVLKSNLINTTEEKKKSEKEEEERTDQETENLKKYVIGREEKCKGIVIRTGFETNQGKLLRTILFSAEHLSANNLEALIFILFLLVFAICASLYVLKVGLKDETKTGYKLFLNCVMIVTSVVPPELPMELSLAVQASLVSLQKLSVFCTEPFRIPVAGKIDVCCFDKTGTLTTENMRLKSIYYPRTNNHYTPSSEINIDRDVDKILGSCHSLILLNNEIIGDPMEKAGLSGSRYELHHKLENVMDKKYMRLKILKRFPFSSDLKRMSVFVKIMNKRNKEDVYKVYCKGAAEVLESRLVNKPKKFMQIYNKLTSQGNRVITLASKRFSSVNYKDINKRFLRNLKRDEIESDLEFEGFAIFSTELKPGTSETINELLESKHQCIMITGDNPFTAIHVAKQLNFLKSDEDILMYNAKSSQWEKLTSLASISSEKIEGDKELVEYKEPMKNIESHNRVITGGALGKQNEEWMNENIPRISVFARTTPEQKEMIITTLKSRGFNTLMCGDGTNDVGGLKQADIGIALLAPEKKIIKKKNKIITKRKKEGEVEESKPMNLKELLKDENFRKKYAKMRFFEKIKFNFELSKNQKLMKRKRGLDSIGGNKVKDLKIGGESLSSILSEGVEQTIVQLGDASIASPFTSKKSSIESVKHVITQGRCTLVTTMQMYKILALNCLLTAYSLSVLYMMGVKFGDKQMVLQGIGIAVCFLFISRASPINKLSPQRPVCSIFDPCMVLSMLGQFIIHLSVLVLTCHAARIDIPLTQSQRNLEGEYEKNLLNSVVFVMETLQAILTFLVNYEGYPFMVPLTKNKKLFFLILAMIGICFVVASNYIPDLNEMLEVMIFPPHFKSFLLTMMISDIILIVSFVQIVHYLFIKVKK